ncbi:MAG: hypothetical protein HQM10_05795 [Candidatus Riflebacteria bacterium]|nr:hypothetical protein [Candidatus Riflebacteria bacterium]
MYTEAEKDKFFRRITEFHTKDAPGLEIGVEMVDCALDLLGKVHDKILAVVETSACLVDVVQIMVGCTTGNKYLQALTNLGRFAVTLYDRKDGRGVRVSVDLSKINKEKTPEIHNFFNRKRAIEVETNMELRKASGALIKKEFKTIGRELFRTEKVNVKTFGKPPILPAQVCNKCEESFLAKNKTDEMCEFCTGTAEYYIPIKDS